MVIYIHSSRRCGARRRARAAGPARAGPDVRKPAARPPLAHIRAKFSPLAGVGRAHEHHPHAAPQHLPAPAAPRPRSPMARAAIPRDPGPGRSSLIIGPRESGATQMSGGVRRAATHPASLQWARMRRLTSAARAKAGRRTSAAISPSSPKSRNASTCARLPTSAARHPSYARDARPDACARRRRRRRRISGGIWRRGGFGVEEMTTACQGRL
jgi:hypothetical protein